MLLHPHTRFIQQRPVRQLRVAVLAHLPFTFAIDFQTGAVDHQMDRFVFAKDRQFDIKRFALRQSVG
ncbi:MAG: hypothetical protein E5299_01030 [Burkholderia gladioli]|nr:MAG: hypothetical protein E5299_01030 [Burkholderia gladioli]